MSKQNGLLEQETPSSVDRAGILASCLILGAAADGREHRGLGILRGSGLTRLFARPWEIIMLSASNTDKAHWHYPLLAKPTSS
eukprot:scaffold229936_cov17-Prasinocladus_malaysianus.AAC.1